MKQTLSDNIILSSTDDNVASAAGLIRAGRLVAFSTETVYGLGADATNEDAIASIFEAKGRPHFNPLIIHLADVSHIAEFVEFGDQARSLAETFWPGALTMVLKRKSNCPISLLASAGLDTLAVRVPNHPLAHALITAAGTPVAAPSANRSGEISPTTAEHVLESLGGRIDAILDGGPCAVGLESTVIDLSNQRPTLLRPGGISQTDIERVLGPVNVSDGSEDAPRSPGMLSRHYAPGIPIRLNTSEPNSGEAFLAFGPDIGDCDANLSPSGDLKEAAANLFAMLRMLDQEKFTGIAVMKIPEDGLGAAINDRLTRAATY